MQASALTAWELFCRKGDRYLFEGLDLWLERGAALRILGRNGTGKTSLLRMLAGLLAPSPTNLPTGYAQVGSVAWQGTVGLIDERAALQPDWTLGRALTFWTKIDSSPDELTARSAERTGIAQLMDVPVRYLSTGQRKRAAMARLLVQQADNWLLDEPLNGLDAEGVSLIERLAAEHREKGGVVVVASHQPICLPQASIVDLGHGKATQWSAAEWAEQSAK